MALTEIHKGKIYQRTGAWREGKNVGYHVSDLYLPLYEKEFFLFFKGFIFHKQSSFPQKTSTVLDLPAVNGDIPVMKQKQSTSATSDLPTASASSDLRNIIVSRKRKANDSRKVERKF